MYAGWVSMRASALGPPPPMRKYCELWGTQLWVYPSEEEVTALRPEACFEILVSGIDVWSRSSSSDQLMQGVSEWDGQDRTTVHKYG